jgi:glycosyltransferase involved in cell wall biosynthesis
MNCLIVSESAGFPWGMAATTRVRNLGNLLIHQGFKVQYIGLQGSGTSSHKSKKQSGFADGMKYSYPGGFPVRSKNWYLRRVDDFLGKWLSLVKIRRLKKRESIDAVIIYSRNYKIVMFWSQKLHALKIKVILELCEWPLANAYNNRAAAENAVKFCNQAIMVVDAILPISSYIENKVKEITNKNNQIIPTFRIPILTDFDISPVDEIDHESNNKEDYILYSGAIDYFDIALFVVDVIYELKNKGFGLKLKFTGGGKEQLFDKIKTYAGQKEVEDLIDFTGYLEEKELRRLMVNALCLLAPLPDTEQSKARFPTKIGYYLSSGRPVITNAVGSVKEYLTDGENACIAASFDAQILAEKIVDIISNPNKGNTIGKTGRQLAHEKFYYENAGIGLREFLTTLK